MTEGIGENRNIPAMFASSNTNCSLDCSTETNRINLKLLELSCLSYFGKQSDSLKFP